jgi:hypothetical protein
MGTRSLISIKNEDGTYDGVYCHFDGYPTGVGKTLKEYYNNEQIIRELISLGDMSCLNYPIETCEFYTKRGEKLHNYKAYELSKLKKQAVDIGCEYLYTFYKGEWNCVDLHGDYNEGFVLI